MTEYIVRYEDEYLQLLPDKMQELVRCKDCEHHGKDTCSAGAGIAYPPPDDWFCADGERGGMTMADREKVIRELQDALKDAEEDGKFYAEIRRPDVFDAIALLKEQQQQIDKLLEESASNAEIAEGLRELLKEQEAKTGKWIEQEDYNLDTYYDCSMCGKSWSTVEGTPWENGMNYCPHCGAKMESIICDNRTEGQ